MAAISHALVEGTWLKMLRYQCTMYLCQAASRKNSAALSASPMQASEWDRRQSDHRHPHRDNFVVLKFSSFFCDAPHPHLLASVASQVLSLSPVISCYSPAQVASRRAR